MVYQCPLCKTLYESDKQVVDCINRCGRKAHDEGKFISKSVYSGETSEVNYEFLIEDLLRFDHNLILDEMIKRGAPVAHVNQLRARSFKDWDKITNIERSKRLNDLCMSASLYGIKIP